MNWGIKVLQTSALPAQFFSAADCVAALSSDALIPDVCSAPHPSRALSPTQNLLRFCGCGKAEVLSPRLFLHEKTRCKHASRFLWRRHPDLNWGIKVLQTSALPLGYVAELARVAGFEPAHDGIRIRCLTAWRYPKI